MRLGVLFAFSFFLITLSSLAQTRVGGIVVDEQGVGIPFANVIFANSSEGVITNDDGRFYLASDNTWDKVEISFLGYKTEILELNGVENTGLTIQLTEDTGELDAVVIYTGKTDKKNNPALDLLKKVWENRRKNGLDLVDQYKYRKYEKLEFDLNTIDSAMINSKLFDGMEFIFDYADTSRVTGKTYLPIFINESLSEVYGDNILDKQKEILQANKNSGFSNNQTIITFVKDLYSDFDIYDRHIKFFDKSFTSPIGKAGIDTYNYVLGDTMNIDGVRSFNVIYYPRRRNGLTFKGDFWVSDSTYAIKEINMQGTKSANINWVKEIYVEQEYEVVNDSIFLITRDYFLSDFALNKKEDSKGIYGKRTTLYTDYEFDQPKEEKFYKRQVNPYEFEVYNREEEYWDENRFEALNEDERQVYTMLDTLKKSDKFKRLYNIGTILATGYVEMDGWDYGNIFSTFGFNDVEGVRLRAGGRTYRGPNDLWRVEGYGAYGFKDNQFKYGALFSTLLNIENRFTFQIGTKRDVEQLGATLTSNRDVLGRSLASSALVSIGANNRLSSINLSTVAFGIEPLYNFEVNLTGSYSTIKSAFPEFSLAYFTDEARTQTQSETRQVSTDLTLRYTPGRKRSGYGVEQNVINAGGFPVLFANYSKGFKGITNADFNYDKVQVYYQHPLNIGGYGRLTSRIEVGKTFGEVPLAYMDVIPGNQTLFSSFGTFPQMDFYEFVTDEYAALHMEHNFNGRILGRIGGIRDLNLREIFGFRAVYGNVSEANRNLNASGLDYLAPKDIYYEFSAGIGNIFKVFRIDFHWRGNYLDNPDARPFGITGAFGFFF